MALSTAPEPDVLPTVVYVYATIPRCCRAMAATSSAFSAVYSTVDDGGVSTAILSSLLSLRGAKPKPPNSTWSAIAATSDAAAMPSMSARWSSAHPIAVV